MADLSFEGSDKEQFVTALAAMVVADSGADVTADNINAVVTGSGNSVGAYWAPLFASAIDKAGGIDKFFSAPGAGAAAGAAPAAADAGGAAAPAAAAKVEVEEVDALEGGMDMFGGDAGGGDY
mmetsp:Transcript_35730/g.26075  ORF Transcript_35730/g.26075 Transcript_35730/m.26075 type:complete len:123 (+) Transcript_35730:41-409(+)|eukprot:CAMPEP_0116921094 /NCGR_PEP_ID=MMETSP0467-20121206/21413_1 /TAXON_ID=283647 /ORGANISM="Mesodinium pulex, Strain SPMC105" /LENGTH=122 /DNA_ID=CAMNT_0004599071 /DNA_START=46 /DNA_END=414 /DNA_ORIENTATION=-